MNDETGTHTYNDACGPWCFLPIPTPARAIEAPREYRVEIKSDEDGCIEEVILHDATRMLVHLERESRDTWWLGIFPEADPVDAWDSDACFDIYRAKKRIGVERR